MGYLTRKCVVFLLAALITLGGLSGLPVAGQATAATQSDTHHHHSPDIPDDPSAEAKCCMLACVPVILNAISPPLTPLFLADKVTAQRTPSVASYHNKPPFHPPQPV